MAREKIIRVFIAAAIALLAAAPLRAESVEQFYRGKIVSLYIGYSVGGGYDLYGRLVARHLGKHIPGNPAVVPINTPGAGGLKLANWLYNVAPKDGTALGTVNRGIPFEPLLGNAKLALFDALKFTWIGSTTNEVGVCVAWKRTGITTFEDLYQRQLIVGVTGPGADDLVHAKLIRGLFGAKLRLVTGYPGGNELNFAMERGEVDGRCGWSWSTLKSSRAEWVRSGDIKILLQVGLKKHPDLPDVPFIMDLAKSDEERKILRLVLLRGVLGRPYLAPPGMDADRAAALRQAFDATVKDPEFLADAARAQLEITPVSGAAMQQLLSEVYATPPDLVERARLLLK